jgi:hypothetical protein
MEKRELYIGFCWESHKEREHWKTQIWVGRIILKMTLEKQDGVAQIYVAQDGDQWQAFVSMVRNLQIT